MPIFWQSMPNLESRTIFGRTGKFLFSSFVVVYQSKFSRYSGFLPLFDRFGLVNVLRCPFVSLLFRLKDFKEGDGGADISKSGDGCQLELWFGRRAGSIMGWADSCGRARRGSYVVGD